MAHTLGLRLEQEARERRAGLVARGVTPSNRSVWDGRTRQAHAYRMLRAAMRTALADGLISDQPCRIDGGGSPRRSAQRTERDLAERLLTPAQVAEVASKMPPRYRALVLAAAWSGLRQGELLALRRRDVNLEGEVCTVRVRRRIRRLQSGDVEVDSPKTKASHRIVVLPTPLATSIRSHMETFVGSGDDALVFTTARGTVPFNGNLTRTLQLAMTKAGVDGVRFHDLRHVAQVLAAESGATTAELMQRMGHSSVDAALIYMHARPERAAVVADRLAGQMVV